MFFVPLYFTCEATVEARQKLLNSLTQSVHRQKPVLLYTQGSHCFFFQNFFTPLWKTCKVQIFFPRKLFSNLKKSLEFFQFFYVKKIWNPVSSIGFESKSLSGNSSIFHKEGGGCTTDYFWNRPLLASNQQFRHLLCPIVGKK